MAEAAENGKKHVRNSGTVSGLVPEWVGRVTDRTADGDENE